MDGISTNFIYAFILTKFRLGLLHIIFRTFVPELWPLIYGNILFLFNILRTNGQNYTKFYICIHIDKITKLYITINTDKIYIGIVSCHFSKICKRVMALD